MFEKMNTDSEAIANHACEHVVGLFRKIEKAVGASGAGVDCYPSDDRVVLSICPRPEDVGVFVGKQGANFHACRLLFNVAVRRWGFGFHYWIEGGKRPGVPKAKSRLMAKDLNSLLEATLSDLCAGIFEHPVDFVWSHIPIDRSTVSVLLDANEPVYVSDLELRQAIDRLLQMVAGQYGRQIEVIQIKRL
jgi:hypothetical protein